LTHVVLTRIRVIKVRKNAVIIATKVALDEVDLDEAHALALAQGFLALKGNDLRGRKVTCDKTYNWNSASWDLE